MMNYSDGLRLGKALEIMGMSIEELDITIKYAMTANVPNKNKEMILSNMKINKEGYFICDLIILLSSQYEDGILKFQSEGKFFKAFQAEISYLYSEKELLSNRYNRCFPLNTIGLYQKNEFQVGLLYFMIFESYLYFKREDYTQAMLLRRISNVFEMSIEEVSEILQEIVSDYEKELF